MSEWTKATQTGSIRHSAERILYVAEPVRMGGDRGTIVAIHDATADYQGNDAIVPVIQVMLVVLVIFPLLAWVTAGRVLFHCAC